jgi:hypothetical protein
MDCPRVKGPWFPVPAGTPAASCRSCDEEVYWITTANDRKMPVDCTVEGGHAPTDRDPGQGVSHFATCPDRDRWRGPRAKR